MCFTDMPRFYVTCELPVQRYPSAVLGKDPSYNENHALNVYAFYLEITHSNNLEYQTATESP